MTSLLRPAQRDAVVRGVGVTAAGSVVLVAIVAFVGYFGATPALLVDQGPLSLQPGVADELRLFFDPTLLRNAQIAIHLIGLCLFWGMGTAMMLRGGSAPMRLGTALMLFLVGTALFAPVSLFEGWLHSVGEAVGTLRPGPEVWRSVAGISLLAFAILFPTGRPLSRWWGWALGALSGHAVAWALAPGTGVDPRTWPAWATIAWTLVPAAGSVLALLIRFGRADEATRLQIRLVVIAFAITLGSIVAFWALDPSLEQGLFDLVLATRRLEVLHDLNLLILLSIGLLLLPIGIAVSVVRHGLWDLGLIINRALVYGAMTALIAGAFVVGVVGIGSLLAGSFGQGRAAAGVATGVVLVLVFQPLRRRVQTAIDRRFYREKYDAEQALDAFMRTVTDLVDASAVSTALDEVLRATVHPDWSALRLGSDVAEGEEALQDVSEADPSLRAAGPKGADMVLPLVVRGETLGALFLGPRRSGNQYTALDRRLLERVAAAVAPAVRVSQLVDEQERQAAERVRLESEMAVARTIQHDLLPQRMPEIDGWRFEAVYESSREVGGDYYDVVVRSDGRIALLVADVSGKGVPAAMLMATCRAVMRSVVDAVGKPSEVLRTVNARLASDIKPGMFITCFFGILDPTSGTFSFANAGHTLPMMRTGSNAVELRATGMPFGWMPDAGYDDVVVELPPGSLVVIPSDGVIEARDTAGEFFGVAGFRRIVSAAPQAGAVRGILDALEAYCAPSTDLGDDVTMLSIARI